MQTNPYSPLYIDDPTPLPPLSLGPSIHENTVINTMTRTGELRIWTKDEIKPGTVRDWNSPNGPISRNPFHVPFTTGSKKRHVYSSSPSSEMYPFPKYAFIEEQDDTEIETEFKDTNIQNLRVFPPLSDYKPPRSPPYPPHDGEHLTLAERVKRAIQHDSQKNTFVPPSK